MMRNRVIATLVLMLALFFTPPMTAFSTGIGNLADNGCLCHGVSDPSTKVEISGLPQAWEANTTYSLSIGVSSIDETLANGSRGGFRLLFSGGEVNYSHEFVQNLDAGLTHTETGSEGRQWQVNWTSPNDATTTVHFQLYGNTVNGDGTNNGDGWSSFQTSLPGVNATSIEVASSGPSTAELGGLIVAVVAIAILFKMMYSNPESGDSLRGDPQPPNPGYAESDSALNENLDSGKDYVQSIDEFN
jgi:hypothetical protein